MKLYGWIIGVMLTLSLMLVPNVSTASMYAQCTQSNGLTLSPALLSNIDDRTLLIKNAIEEASIDGDLGMAAITTVVLNRYKKSGFPIRELIQEYKQFSWTLEPHKVARTPLFYGKYWCRAEGVVYDTIRRWLKDNDYITNGADHYARTDYILQGKVDWAYKPAMHYRKIVGSHTFCEYMPTLKPKNTKVIINNTYIRTILRRY